MKRLILMRHAKSDWSDLTLSDHERSLNDRGRRSAEAVGHWLRAKALVPDHVLCSDATRTRETLTKLKLGTLQTTFTKKLYLAEPEEMAGMLRQQQQDCILMVAHNPGSAMLAERLVTQPPAHNGFDSFPTCATLVLDFDINDWRDMRHGTANVVAFTVPRDLIE